jgi:dolichol-phosphate mannosyltransferase
VEKGFASMTGDAASVMMADEADDCRDVVRYWKLLNQGLKLRLNRLANAFIMLMFGIKLNDTTNAFKAYRATLIQGCLPLLSPHFNLTAELR